MDLSDLGAVAAAAAALYLFVNNKKGKAVKAPTTTQELIRYKEITPDGIVELENHQYRLVIEVEPLNMNLKSTGEQELIWLGFRDLINVLTIPVTCLVQTRFLDLKDYISDLHQLSTNAPTPQLQEYGYNHCNYLSEKTENRDRRHYIILKIDALAVSSIDSGLKIENETLNALLTDLKSKRSSNISNDEIKSLAHQELENLAGVIQGCLNGMEIQNVRLNKQGVMDLIYSTFNRDLAPHARLSDASAQEIFSLTTRSLTPFMTVSGGK